MPFSIDELPSIHSRSPEDAMRLEEVVPSESALPPFIPAQLLRNAVAIGADGHEACGHLLCFEC